MVPPAPSYLPAAGALACSEDCDPRQDARATRLGHWIADHHTADSKKPVQQFLPNKYRKADSAKSMAELSTPPHLQQGRALLLALGSVLHSEHLSATVRDGDELIPGSEDGGCWGG